MPLLEVPADVVQAIMQVYYQESDTTKYGLSWSATKANQVAVGLRWATRFSGMKFADFRKLASQEGGADLIQQDGLWEYVWRGPSPPVESFGDATVVDGPTFAVTPPLTALTTRLKVSWDLDYVTGSYRASQELLSDQAGRIGNREGRTTDLQDTPQTLELPLVNDLVTALWVGHDRLRALDRQVVTVALSASWRALAVRKQDTIKVTSAVLTKRFGGSIIFRVLGKRYRLQADDLIELLGAEAPASILQLVARVALRFQQAYSLLAGVAIAQSVTLLGGVWITGFSSSGPNMLMLALHGMGAAVPVAVPAVGGSPWRVFDQETLPANPW